MRKLWVRNVYWQPYYEGEGGEGGGNGEGGNSEGGGKEGTGGGDGEEKKFSQKDLDKALNYRFRKERQEKENLVKQLNDLKEKGLTPEARETLESEIQKLNESMQTKEQTLQQKMEEANKKHTKLLEGVTGERDLWKNRYHTSINERAILDAAVAANAEDPSQFVMMFSGSTRLEEVMDSTGKGTGKFVSMMKFKGLDTESKKLVDMDLPTAEAVAHMKEHGLHKNLFKHTAVNGTGSPGQGSGTGRGTPDKMPVPEDFPGDPVAFRNAYQTWRQSFNIDGTPIKKA